MQSQLRRRHRSEPVPAPRVDAPTLTKGQGRREGQERREGQGRASPSLRCHTSSAAAEARAPAPRSAAAASAAVEGSRRRRRRRSAAARAARRRTNGAMIVAVRLRGVEGGGVHALPDSEAGTAAHTAAAQRVTHEGVDGEGGEGEWAQQPAQPEHGRVRHRAARECGGGSDARRDPLQCWLQHVLEPRLEPACEAGGGGSHGQARGPADERATAEQRGREEELTEGGRRDQVEQDQADRAC
eukprot:scaffold30606_cov62-Phaeocystis_antarctica.AAC.1